MRRTTSRIQQSRLWLGVAGLSIAAITMGASVHAEEAASTDAAKPADVLAGPKVEKPRRRGGEGVMKREGKDKGEVRQQREGRGEGDHEGRNAERRRPGAGLREALLSLDLTAEQKTQLREQGKAHHEAMQENREAHEAEREAARASMQKLRADMKAAHEAGDKDKIADLRQQAKTAMEARHATMEARKNEMLTNVGKILTEAQMTELKAILAKQTEAMKSKRGGMRPDGASKREGRPNRGPGAEANAAKPKAAKSKAVSE